MLLSSLKRRIVLRKKVKSTAPPKSNDNDVEKGDGQQRHDTIKGESLTNAKRRRATSIATWRPQKVVRFIIEDWLFLVALGFTVALLSLGMETCIIELQALRRVLMEWVKLSGEGAHSIALEFLAWVGYTTVLVVASAAFTHYVAPQAIGSGIPEMKTILRGVMLKEYLSLRTLISKMVGLTLAIGSGLPIGKEGPFAHVGSIVANLFSRLIRSFQPIYANESRSCELLAAGCAVGVACTFSAPVGGVLFSIEVTAVYFAVRDYWRGFFAAACSSIVFALLRLYTQSSEVTVVAFFQTNFKQRSFVPEELLFFALIGLFCGVTGAIFIFIHRRFVLFLRRNRFMKAIFQKHWLIYPVVISFLHAVINYSKFLGQFISGETLFNRKVWDFFMNCTWSANSSSPYACPPDLIERWTGLHGENSMFLELPLFVFIFYFMCIIAVTLPVPAGIFMPVFVVGAGMGRLFGELMAIAFPDGIRGEGAQIPIYPGIYSVVGAASFCGAVTHTVSVAIITFEMTGQLMHTVPVMIAVIIANIVCSALQPSFFDSIIMIKRLPYLPDIPKSASAAHAIRVEQIMVRKVMSLSKTSTYREVKNLLDDEANLRAFPVVNDPGSMILVGSVSRKMMEQALEIQIGEEAKMQAAVKRARRIEWKRARTKSSIPTAKAAILHEQLCAECMAESDPPQLADCDQSKFNECDQLNDNSVQGILNYGLSLENDSTMIRKQRSYSSPEHWHSAANRSHSAPSLHRSKPTKHRSWSNHKLFMAETHKKVHHSVTGIVHNIAHSFHHHHHHNHHHEKKHKSIPEFTPEEERKWLEKQLSKPIDFSVITIDDSPFQLVQQSSLYKAHSLFSILGVSRAYVTENGVLVGVVSLKELRLAIELAQAGAVELPALSRTEQTWSPNVRAQSIIENLAEETDTDDEDVISPRAVLEERHPSSAQLKSEAELVRKGSESTCYSTGDDTESSGTERGKTLSRSLFKTMKPLSDSLNGYLQCNMDTNDVRRMHSATESNTRRRAAVVRFDSLPTETEMRVDFSADTNANR